VSVPFTLGVNYWPRRKAMDWWANFDPGEVRDEFALVASLGLNLVRVFLRWEDFQPAPETVSPQALAHLAVVADIAHDHGLQLDVTFFTGHMSGPNWSPGWLLNHTPPPAGSRPLISGGRPVHSGIHNPYVAAHVLEAEHELLRAVITRLRQHPAIGLWNLGNEPDLFAWPPTAAAGRAWVRNLVRFIKDLDPLHPVTCGLHFASLTGDNGLRVSEVFAETDLAVMHAYPMYVHWARHPLDPDFVPYACALTAALAGQPVLMEEFGGCTAPPGEPSVVWEWPGPDGPRRQFMASESALADYLAAVLPRLVAGGVTGALLWCFADYAPELWDRPPCNDFRHERHFGLVRPDGSLKPHAEVLRAFAATAPSVQPLPAFTLPVSPADYYRDPGRWSQELYTLYLSQHHHHL
jgi:endo-1,4-beta-mannosidase